MCPFIRPVTVLYIDKVLNLLSSFATFEPMLWNFTQRILALFLLILLGPLFIFCIVVTFLQDRKNPFYVSCRVGKNGKLFSMIKLRTMVVNSDEVNPYTSCSDVRITKIGWIMRFLKLDEFFQLINVIKGDMLLIGPRPRAVLEYQDFTSRENDIISILPGISDFAVLFMSREGELLSRYTSPYDTYLHICRPIKSRLALFYIEHRSVWVDCVLLFFNATNFISRRWTLRHMAKFIVKLGDCGVPYEILSGEKEPYPMDLPR